MKNIFHFDYQLTVKIVTSYLFRITIFRYCPDLIYGIPIIQSSPLLNIFTSKNDNIKKKQKLAAVSRETQKEHPRNSQSWNMSVPGITEECITQVSEEIEGKVLKNCSRILAGQSPSSWELSLN